MTLIGDRSPNHTKQVTRRGTHWVPDDRATQWGLFATIDASFSFTIDVAASAQNTKCARYYADPEAADGPRHPDLFNEPVAAGDTRALGYDGLAHSWADESVWCNPPYSDIKRWVLKAWHEHETARSIVMLLPANRTEQNWWQDHVEPHRDRPDSPLKVEFLPGRIQFLRPGQHAVGPDERSPFGCCLLIWEAA